MIKSNIMEQNEINSDNQIEINIEINKTQQIKLKYKNEKKYK